MKRRVGIGDIFSTLGHMLFALGFVLMVLAMTFTFFVYMPVSVHAEKKCLAAGYPETRVDYMLNAYCLNLDGTVTVTVKALNEEER